MKNYCLQCGKIPKRSAYRFCSNNCQLAHQYQTYIENWQNGKVDGGRGLKTRNVSGYVRKYLREKYGEKCSGCGWNVRHPSTSHVPLEIDHIDGNAENNNESNLRLLCPNCHSLTPKFRSLNNGNGRQWRKNKYIRNSD